MSTPRLYIEGVAFWAPALPGWASAKAAFRGEGALSDPPVKRPSPMVLAPAERRRAPDTVALALEVAAAATAASGREARELPCIFVCSEGDLSINDYMCMTLASDPKMLSPTKFHNSVHNAPVGYWTIGTGCMESSTSLSAFDRSFAAGLLEAATQCAADGRSLLLVAYDTAAIGALASSTVSEGMLAVAMVLSPELTAQSVATLDWSLVPGNGLSVLLQSEAARSLQRNAMADALPVFEAFANESTAAMDLPLSSALSLRIQMTPSLTPVLQD